MIFLKTIEKIVYSTKRRFVHPKNVKYLEKVDLHKRMRVKTSK